MAGCTSISTENRLEYDEYCLGKVPPCKVTGSRFRLSCLSMQENQAPQHLSRSRVAPAALDTREPVAPTSCSRRRTLALLEESSSSSSKTAATRIGKQGQVLKNKLFHHA
eukprot:1142555-Pelagomonas_calceolata.AAC.5